MIESDERNRAAPFVSVTIFHVAGVGRLWAFAMMARAPGLLRGIEGLGFSRMMGSGRGLGFTLLPDTGRYALLAVWENRAAYNSFVAESRFIRLYTTRTHRTSALLLRPRTAHGAWDGVNPFLPTAGRPDQNDAASPIVVLTRATIRLRSLRRFWHRVPGVQRRLVQAEGFLASVGVGERPFTRQATLSLWRDEQSITAFAYGPDEEHRDVVRRTRAEGWYSEELFARFDLVEMIGSFP